MKRRHSASLLSGAVVAFAFAFAPGAHASPDFPEKLQSLLDMSCPPPCTICHLDSNGGTGTAVKPFGDAMAEAGLRAKETDKLAPALEILEGKGSGSGGTGGSGGSAGSSGSAGAAGSSGSAGAAGSAGAGADDAGADAAGGSGGSGGSGGGTVVDSDEDGMGDVEELRNDRDPNISGAGVVCGPTYGCGARVEPRGRVDGFALAAALAVAGALLLSARRRR